MEDMVLVQIRGHAFSVAAAPVRSMPATSERVGRLVNRIVGLDLPWRKDWGRPR